MHPGQAQIQSLYGTFELESASGHHQCLLQPPMGGSLSHLVMMNGGPLELPAIKVLLRQLLLALDSLHEEAEVIHTDIKLDNMAIARTDNAVVAS